MGGHGGLRQHLLLGYGFVQLVYPQVLVAMSRWMVGTIISVHRNRHEIVSYEQGGTSYRSSTGGYGSTPVVNPSQQLDYCMALGCE